MNKILTLSMRRLFDAHCHFRTESLMSEVLPETAEYASYGIAMPNTRPRAILTGEDVIWYRDEIRRVLDGMLYPQPFEPLMTIEIRDNTTPEMIIEAHRAGAVAGKVYPLGVTTNSDEGLRYFFSYGISETFKAMQDVGMLLLIHGELDQARILVIKREMAFLPIFRKLALKLPDLKIVLEHVSTEAGVRLVRQLGENVAATITAHHLCLTLNDVIGYGIQPHHGCMPMPKSFDDRDALIKAVTSGNSKFFLGSDTAPHPREKKECAKGACGVYTAPILPQLLAEIFEEAGHLEKLEDFTSRFGVEFYDIPPTEDSITLTKEEWVVPEQIGSVVPFRASTKLQWKIL